MKEQIRYTLRFKNYDLGVVDKVSNEWPRSSGVIDLNLGLKKFNEETQTIFKYFNFSIKASSLLEKSEYDYKDFLEKNESLYLELINSNEWLLVDQFGKHQSILVPILHENNCIIWTKSSK